MNASNESNGNPISSFNDSSINKCVARCDSLFGCLSVNFHEVNKQCKPSDYYPLDNTTSGIPNNGWKIYFRRNFGINLLQGAEAWQSTTFRSEHHMIADKAIDGKVEGIHNCAHTLNFSYWAVEFGTPGPVKSVQIMLRRDCCFERQTNFTVTVAKSRENVINDAGTDCGSYFGPAINNEPFSITINCTNTIFGMFLKIKHESTETMALCEVYIYTP
ncbi:uncharacterized protein LOC132734033 [Ruditapes philippinarum]|uniref:uncharacterized protein LOC132734033 n=1 Tax=Ruditapes philippinarum TaxID=129788 RepID=UPI00295A6CD6|nr:uncharacterized protein LOC132734033 [Ruditapes philippinarum]